MLRSRQLLLTLGLLALSATTPALAQEAESKAHSGLGFGVKGGIGFGPEQFVLGAQMSLGKALGFIRVVPNAHLGFGDGTSFDVNIDFLARLVVADKGFGIYGGVAPGWVTYDGGNGFGLTGVLGTQLPIFKGKATNLEGRLRITDEMPDFRLLVAIVF
jgi:hypothetical protein